VSSLDLPGLIAAVRAIDPENYGPGNVGRMMTDVRIGSAEVAPNLQVAQGRYTRNLVYACDDFEVAILCWDKAAASPVHDHAGQHCWFTTLEGSFDVEDYRCVAGGSREGYARVEKTGVSQCVRAGVPDYRYGANEIHRVAVTPGYNRAISLHIYSKPLASCMVFDPLHDRCARRVLTYDRSIETLFR
jgi:hypothetical protein